MAVDLKWEKIVNRTREYFESLGPHEPLAERSYEQLGQEIGRLVEAKQKQYGDSFSVAPHILALLYPDGVPVARYDSLLAVVRILDKLKRVATQDPSDTEDHWGDICGYSLLMQARGRK